MFWNEGTAGIHYRITGCHFGVSRVRILNDVPVPIHRTFFIVIGNGRCELEWE